MPRDDTEIIQRMVEALLTVTDLSSPSRRAAAYIIAGIDPKHISQYDSYAVALASIDSRQVKWN